MAAWPAAQRKSYSGTAGGAAARSDSSDLSSGRQRGGAGSGGPRAGPLKQLRLLLLRSWRQVGSSGAGQGARKLLGSESTKTNCQTVQLRSLWRYGVSHDALEALEVCTVQLSSWVCAC